MIRLFSASPLSPPAISTSVGSQISGKTCLRAIQHHQREQQRKVDHRSL